MGKITGSAFLARAVEAYGLSHVFMVPYAFTEALAKMEDSDICRVSAHSEAAAVYMADGYARASRRPGLVFVQAVGAANAAAGLREPYLACSPVILFTGGPAPATRYRHLYQEIEDFPMFTPVTKSNVRMEDVGRLPDLLRQAFRTATTGSPGPVHMEVPGRFGEAVEAEGELALYFEDLFGQYPPYRPEPEPAAVLEALEVLAAAERPVIVAGGGVVSSGAAPELVEFAEALSIPVASSLNGKETIPDSHPLCLGTAGTYGRWSANQALAEADVVFWVGSRAGGHVTDNWQAPPLGTPAIQLDIDAAEIGRNYPVKVGVVADARAGLRRLIAGSNGLGKIGLQSKRRPWLEHTQALLAEWRAEYEALASPGAVPIRPEYLCKEISDALAADAVVVTDTGHAAIWGAQMIELRRPTQRYIRCAGTLGWGFPGAIGVKCALPEKQVVALIGDGGFYYHMAEMETAARMGINVVVVVNNNSCMSQTREGFDAAYGGSQHGRGCHMWCYRQVDFAAAAEMMGCLGIRVEHPSEVRPALAHALSAGRPVVVDVVGDMFALPPGPWRKT